MQAVAPLRLITPSVASWINRTINPYQPAPPLVDDRTRLTFDSVIELNDYADLIPHRVLEAVLIKFLCGLIAFISVLIAAAIIFGLMRVGWGKPVIPAGLLSLVLMVGAAFLGWYSQARQLAHRQLKQNPDLISVARGEMTELGISFHDGVRQHWFGPQHLVNTVVSELGVRIYVDQNPYRYLALTSRMFDGYNVEVANRLKLHWCDTAAKVTDPSEPAGLESWNLLTPPPEDAIAFAGAATTTQPMRTRDVRQNAIIASVSIVFMIVMGLIRRTDHPWIKNALLGYALFALYGNIHQWWSYFRGTRVQTWNQRGWISPREFAILLDSRGIRMSLDEIANFTDYGPLITATTKSGSVHYLFREHLANDEQWPDLQSLTKSLPMRPD